MTRILVVAVLLYAGTARADEPPIELDVSQLAANHVKIGVDNGPWEVFKGGKSRCKGKATNKQLEITDPKCGLFDTAAGAYWADDGPTLHITKAGKPVSIKLTLPKPGLLANGEALKLSSKDLSPLKGFADVWYYGDQRWQTATVASLATNQELAKGELQVWVSDAGTWKQATIVMAKPADSGDAGGPPVTAAQAEKLCGEARTRYAPANVLCFAYDGSWVHLPDAPERGVVMRANTRLVVIAYAPKGSQIEQALAGDLGFSDPKVRNEATGTTTSARDESPPQIEDFPREWGPPKPGVHTLTLTLKGKAGADDTTKVDVTVDEVYAGAVRLGVGAVFGGARDRTFTAQTLPGSGQAEITTTDGGAMDAELVLGATAYLFDPGGRAYFAGPDHHWAPYFGIGLLNQSQSGLELLKSIHVGLEYELSRQFSIAFTVVGRRVTRLADGLDVGDPITAMTVPTRTGYEIGVGIVVNLSPEFLKVAKSPSGGFFK